VVESDPKSSHLCQAKRAFAGRKSALASKNGQSTAENGPFFTEQHATQPLTSKKLGVKFVFWVGHSTVQ
jgi:hypothetical protein